MALHTGLGLTEIHLPAAGGMRMRNCANSRPLQVGLNRFITNPSLQVLLNELKYKEETRTPDVGEAREAESPALSLN